MNTYRIFPEPKQCAFYDGFLPAGIVPQYSMDPEIAASCALQGVEPVFLLNQLFGDVRCGRTIPFLVEKTSCHPEGFQLTVDASAIRVQCAAGAGMYYALGVLRQLMVQGGGAIPYVDMADEPALSIRGIMLDVGRDKIPSMETLYRLIDLFAAMRINHLQLYMEGFCFDYEEFHYLFANETPMTPEEYLSLSSYAKAHFIDLVPNQNVLGHMEKWLAKPQFRSLAECEDGYLFENLFWRPPMTLDVRDPRSFKLARALLDTLLKHSSSRYVNVNMDEPFELGMGKNREAVEKDGRLNLYFEYMEQLNEYCKSKGKRMMVWGDEVLHHPECVERFPKDVTLLDWIYEGDAHFENHAKLMQATGLSYCLCPGTGSWGSLTGRSDNMAKNIRDAASCAIRYKGLGIITTDWGDLGHWQYLSVSYPGFAYAAACSWSGPDADPSVISWYCDCLIYESREENAFQTAWDLGNYYHLEHAPLYNTTLAFAVMSSKYVYDSAEEFDARMKRLLTLSANIARSNGIQPQMPEISIDYPAMEEYLDRLDTRIAGISMGCCDADLIKAEMENGLRMVRHGIRLYHAMKELRDDLPAFRDEMKALFDDLDGIMKIHYRLWTARNRQGGFERSTAHMNHLLLFYRKNVLPKTEPAAEAGNS